MSILSEYYRWFLAFHLISVMFWMAGMYYLPRLFVYHMEAFEANQPFHVFETMEVKLLRIIMNPAMIAAWFFAILMIIRPGFLESAEWWFWIKLVSVIILTGFHMFLAKRPSCSQTEIFYHHRNLKYYLPDKISPHCSEFLFDNF